MKNILLLTTIYPITGRGNKGTEVCHFFARDWVKEGYNVKVYHFQTIYPAPYYWAAKMLGNFIAAKTGAIVYTSPDTGDKFERDGVDVTRIPLIKNVPHGKYRKSAVSDAVKQIELECTEASFVPDIIVGHFPNPQVQVLYELKKIYPLATTASVLHLIEEIDQLEPIYGKSLQEYMDSIDVWGFRFKHLRDVFINKFSTINKSFICYSGIPEGYLINENNRTFTDGVKKFVYVGEMIERKYPIKVMDALCKSFPQKDFLLEYIGAGNLIESIKSKIQERRLTELVHVLGKIPRKSILDHYDSADCMVMISKGEAFGLVYIEAMARGCITIASRNEGIDGVIVDGVNGFLCEAGNADELSAIITKLNSMTPEELRKISQAAIETASSLTDSLAASRYINDVIELGKK